jgi:Cys-tRNA(Pro)/Cys-tRNA(Cys) deacylase
MAPAIKTNAMRALDARGIPYEVLAYGTAEEFHTAVEVAELLGLSPDEVYKTIVVMPERGRPLLVMVAAHREIDLRVLARSLGEKPEPTGLPRLGTPFRGYRARGAGGAGLRVASQKEAESLTGLRVGGISALALLGRPFEALLDRPAASLERVAVSAGQRGLQLRLATADLLAVTGARLVEATASG